MIPVLYILIRHSEACGTPKWECPWVPGIMGLKVRREGQDGATDQEVISIRWWLKSWGRRSSVVEFAQGSQEKSLDLNLRDHQHLRDRYRRRIKGRH